MKKIDTPSNNFREIYEKCTSHSRKKDIYISAYANIEIAYLNYLSKANESINLLSSITSIVNSTFPITEKMLISLYNSKLLGEDDTRPYYEQIRSNSPYCPYCGTDLSKTIDHFLPKETFPEFSIFPPNLVPCCWDCNHTKSSSLKYLHPYFDNNIYSKQFLYANIEYNDNSPYLNFFVDIQVNDDEDSKTFERLKNHFQTLNLENRYRIHSGSELIKTRSQLEQISEIENRKKFLKQTVHNITHPNNWEKVLYKTLGDNERFIMLNWQLPKT